MSDRSTRQSPSRAELLRQKRQQPSRVPVMPAKKNTPEPARQPITNPFGKSAGNPVRPPAKHAAVVTTRNYPYSTPLRQTVNTPVRRKIYHVNGNGVETRLPSLPMIHFSWQWVSGFMTVVLVTIVLLMIYLPAFEVNQVQVNGIQRIALADVQNVVLTATDSIFTLDRQKVIKAVGLTFPELTNIDLQVDASGLLIVTVTERQPVLVWNAGSFSYWIDSEGVLMDPIGEPGSLLTINSDCGIPLITPLNYVTNVIDYVNMVLARAENPITPEDNYMIVDPVVLKAAIDLSTQMPAGSSMVYDNISGMGWQDSRGWKVYFGLSLEDIQFKLVEYQAIVARLTEIGVTPSTISVEHIDSPYYRTE